MTDTYTLIERARAAQEAAEEYEAWAGLANDRAQAAVDRLELLVGGCDD